VVRVSIDQRRDKALADVFAIGRSCLDGLFADASGKSERRPKQDGSRKTGGGESKDSGGKNAGVERMKSTGLVVGALSASYRTV
jgi:hypothetical protein